MKFTLKKPCAYCPFRTDIRPFLRRDRAQQIADSLLDQQQTFACHKTVDYSEDSAGRVPDDAQHCAGAMIMLEHMGRPNQMMRISERLGFYDRTKLDMEAPIFAEADEWVEAQNT